MSWCFDVLWHKKETTFLQKKWTKDFGVHLIASTNHQGMSLHQFSESDGLPQIEKVWELDVNELVIEPKPFARGAFSQVYKVISIINSHNNKKDT